MRHYLEVANVTAWQSPVAPTSTEPTSPAFSSAPEMPANLSIPYQVLDDLMAAVWALRPSTWTTVPAFVAFIRR